MPTRRSSKAELAVRSARAAILSSNYLKLEAARAGLESLLRNWILEYSSLAPTLGATGDGSDVAQIAQLVVAREIAQDVASLWVRYARLDAELRQYGHATSVFERALECPVAGEQPSVWSEYALFCAERGRLATARKVFKRGLKQLKGEAREAVLESYHAFACKFMHVELPLADFRWSVFPDEREVECREASPKTVRREATRSRLEMSLGCRSDGGAVDRDSSEFHEIWYAAIDRLALPSPATASTVSSMAGSRLDDGTSCGSSTDDGGSSSDQEEARPAEPVSTPAATSAIGSKRQRALQSAREKRSERRRQLVECEFCQQLVTRACKRGHSMRCRLRLGVAMSEAERRAAVDFIERERLKRAKYREKKRWAAGDS